MRFFDSCGFFWILLTHDETPWHSRVRARAVFPLSDRSQPAASAQAIRKAPPQQL